MREIGGWFGLEVRDDGGEGGAGDACATVLLLGCPFDDPDAFRTGASAGPAEIRHWARTAEAVTEGGAPVSGVRVVDLGDVEAGADPADRGAAIRSAAGAAMEARPGGLLLGLGGDHGVTPPLIEAVAATREPPAVLLLDAHPDAFRRYAGRTDSHACLLPRIWEIPGVHPGATAVVGTRSYAPEELEILDRAALWVTAAEWQRRGSEAVADELVDVLAGRPLYLSIDIDVLDPSAAPGTGYPVPGGPDVRTLLRLLERVTERLDPAGIDVVEVAPALDPTGITAATAAHLCLQILGFLGRRRRSGPQPEAGHTER